MKVLRSTFVAAVAVVAAACGDKVNIVQPTSDTTPRVNSVAVAPTTATMTIGSTVPFTAAVDVSNGAATTVTWSSSDATKVSVTAAGVASAVAATPGVAICATSTVDVNKKGCASVSVTATTPIVPATVSIQSITVTGNINTTVNPAAVAGSIDVRANVAPGNQTVSKIVVMVGTTRADSQTFTAAEAASLRYAADQAIADQSAFPPVLFTINTAKFNATTGAATWVNGNYNISVVLYVAGSTTASSTATYQTALTFTNANAFSSSVTVGGTTATANNATGFKYTKGDLTVNVIPISYSGIAMASANVNFGTAACDASLIAQRTIALTAPTAPAVTWTATLANSGTAGAGNLKSYEFSAVACAGANSTGETFTVVAAQGTDGNPFTTTALPLAVGAGYRVDNRGPGAPATAAAINVNPNGRANGWINDAVDFTKVTAALTDDRWIAAAVTDAGVSGVTYGVRVSTTLTVAGTKAAAVLNNAATLSPSATNGTYCGLPYAFDALGNSSPDAGACTLFGVDRAAPTASYAAGSIADQSRNAAAPGIEFIVTGADTGLVGNSGLLPAAPGTATVIFRGNGNTAAQACFMGAIVSSVCTPVAMTAAAPNYSSIGMAATAGNTVATEGYYTFTGALRDAAGNSTSVSSRITLVDATAPTVGAASGPLSVASGYTFPVSALINENLDIQNFFFSGGYAGAPAPFAPTVLPQGTVTAVNGYNAATFINTNYAANGTFNLPVAIQANVAAGLTPVSSITLSGTNQANTVTTGASATIPTFGTAPTAISTASFATFGAATLPAGKTGISSGLATAAVTAKPLSSTLSVTTTGATAVFNNPFSRMDFYGLNVAGTAWVFLGTTTASTLTDDGVTRTFTYSIPVTGSTVFTALGGTTVTITQNVIAFGFKSDGSVAMVNAAALALNIVY